MIKSLEALLRDSIDYAGLFPPAKLPFPEAFANYLQYRATNDSWLLARFILPLKLFAPFCDTMSRDPQHHHPVRVTTIGGEASGEVTSVDELAKELSYLPMLSESHPHDLHIESYEAKLSQEIASEIVHFHRVHPLLSSPSTMGERMVSVLLAQPEPLRVFFEFPIDSGTITYSQIDVFVKELAAMQQFLIQSGKDIRVGIKIRCGGKTPPTAFNIASVIKLVANSPTPVLFKATQGLHHPFYNAQREEPHGFINLFAATVLTATHHIDSEKKIAEMLTDSDHSKFTFAWESMRWGEYSVTLQQIEQARKMFQSIGSCSYDEPREDLRAIGLL
ncbi:MAG: hypothetical protein OEM52_01370 [bacterium]|nr:hypothetical protein [bacterium]